MQLTKEDKINISTANAMDTMAHAIQMMIKEMESKAKDHSQDYLDGVYSVYEEVLDQMREVRLEMHEKLKNFGPEIEMSQIAFPGLERAEMTIDVLTGLLEMVDTIEYDKDKVPADAQEGIAFAIEQIKNALQIALNHTLKVILDKAGDDLFTGNKKH